MSYGVKAYQENEKTSLFSNDAKHGTHGMKSLYRSSENKFFERACPGSRADKFASCILRLMCVLCR